MVRPLRKSTAAARSYLQLKPNASGRPSMNEGGMLIPANPETRSMRPLCSLRVTVGLLAVSLGMACFPLIAAGQQPPPGLVEVKDGTRRGFWLGAGLGAGGESNDVGGPGYSDLFYQPTISFRG